MIFMVVPLPPAALRVTVLPDGLILNYDDIQIVETTKDGKTVTFKAAGGKGTTIKYHVAGKADETNK